eukprot:TRINITY_DN1297_c0_g1_i7.p1 TRINITY_DN1297_c0_g1~~TRINITY_DN1297_c0_g1_i7.p1  ORF type:complete len:412 (-),score=82.61 TRINITY_DN1297_c0_g1_i7:60-1295(-)
MIFSANTKACTGLQYSDGGHLLAAVNGTQINIYNPYCFDILYTFNGHTSTIKKMHWLNQDKQLVSSCNGGILNCWNLYSTTKDDEKCMEHFFKQHKYYDVDYDFDYDLVVAVCEDYKLRIYKDKGRQLDFEYDTSPSYFTSLLIVKKFKQILFGTNNGSVRIYFWPFWQKMQKSIEFLEIPLHQTSITQIRVTPDYQHLVTCSEDDVIFFSKILQYSEGKDITIELMKFDGEGQDMENISNTYSLNPLALCSKQSTDAQKEVIKELEFRLQNFKSDIDDEKERKIELYEQKINILQEKQLDQKNKNREQLQQVFQEKEDQYINTKDKLENLKKEFEKQCGQLNKLNEEQLSECYNIQAKLQSQLQQLKDKYKTQYLSLIHISEPTRLGMISYAVFCLKKKKKKKQKNYTNQ